MLNFAFWIALIFIFSLTAFSIPIIYYLFIFLWFSIKKEITWLPAALSLFYIFLSATCYILFSFVCNSYGTHIKYAFNSGISTGFILGFSFDGFAYFLFTESKTKKRTPLWVKFYFCFMTEENKKSYKKIQSELNRLSDSEYFSLLHYYENYDSFVYQFIYLSSESPYVPPVLIPKRFLYFFLSGILAPSERRSMV